ncbi:hypothetical protein FRC03_007624 [Tulasnella sp. 419]|nr:hypothetical protein FRC03_007624 [Tulasnella sp. 419]
MSNYQDRNTTTSPSGTSTHPRPFTNGVYCPLTIPFKAETEEIDFDAFQTQIVRLAKARTGLVLHGTNGEAPHLSDVERSASIRAAREALDKNDLTHVPLLVGTGTGSARETIRLCKEAKEAGADYAIVIAPGYFGFAIARNRTALKEFFLEVLDNSPIPVMIYNFPGASSGIDLDSDFIIELSEHQNCFGTKLTCAGVGKGYRVSAHTQTEAYKSRHPTPFHVLPGYADYLFQALLGRSTGCITGTANIVPKTIVKLYDTCMEYLQTNDPAKLQEALALQDMVAEADWTIIKAGISGTKYAINEYVQPGLGGVPRRPLPLADDAVKAILATGLKKVLEYEKTL